MCFFRTGRDAVVVFLHILPHSKGHCCSNLSFGLFSKTVQNLVYVHSFFVEIYNYYALCYLISYYKNTYSCSKTPQLVVFLQHPCAKSFEFKCGTHHSFCLISYYNNTYACSTTPQLVFFSGTIVQKVFEFKCGTHHSIHLISYYNNTYSYSGSTTLQLVFVFLATLCKKKN